MQWVDLAQHRTRNGAALGKSEEELLLRVRTVVNAGDEPNKPSRSLAADLARSFAGLFDDTWVWGITLELARMLHRLADAYEAKLS